MSTLPLHVERELVLSSLGGSTTHRAQEVATFLGQVLQAQDGRAAGARKVAQQRHEELRDRIIAVAGAMGLVPQLRGWCATVRRRIERDRAKLGFDVVPDMRTIRKARRYLLKNGTTQSSCPPLGL